MADERIMIRGAQDTENPVLDSLVNLAAALGVGNEKNLVGLHRVLLECAAKEPGDLKDREGRRTAVDVTGSKGGPSGPTPDRGGN